MVDLPPGVVYLVQHLPGIAAPPLLTYLLAYVAETHLDLDISTALLRSALVLSFPVALTLRVQWKNFLNWYEAKRRGAVMPPTVPDLFPGGLGSLYKGTKAFKTGYVGDGLEEISKKYGYTFNMRIFFENRYVTADPDYIKASLATQFNTFEKGPELRQLMRPLLGTGVFAADGELWKFHRSMTRPFFSRDRISHFDNFDRHAEDALSQMRARFRDGLPVDFQDVVARFTLDSATEFLFGNDVRSLSEGLPYPFYYNQGESLPTSTPSDSKTAASKTAEGTSATQFVRAFSEAQSITAFRMRFGDHWPLIEFWKNKMTEPMRIVHAYIDPIVGAAIQNKRKEESRSAGGVGKDKDDETLLENLVNSTEDPVILRDEIMNLLVAGRDTTASTLTFTVYMLAEHPEVLKRLRAEILTKIGPNRKPTYDDFRDMKFLRAVINETLRLYPVVPFNIRVSKVPTILPSKVPGGKPIFVPANIRVPYSVFLMHRREDLWGPDVLEFDPDRFLDERLQKYLTPNPFIFLPFNAGPRICLGQQFAYNEASFFLVRLLQKFASISLAADAQPLESRPPVEWAEDPNPRKRGEKVRPKTHLTMYVQDGLWVRMEEAAESLDAEMV